MVLNIPSVFGTNDDVLKARWQQSGSDIKNIYQSGDDFTVYTVTSGKTLYISAIQFTSIAVDAGTCYLKDGGVGGTTKILCSADIQDTLYIINLDVPIKFTTDIYANTNDSFVISLQGWEE